MGSEEITNHKPWSEPVVSAVNKIKNFAKSSENFVKSMVPIQTGSDYGSPIEILKRLQREAFTDLMKLRDRLDKVERMLTFYKSNKGSPFQEANTRMRGEVNVVGALLLKEKINQHSCETLSRAGIESRFIFETIVREKDALITEFITKQTCQGNHRDDFGSFLAIAKVMYLANLSDCFSVIAIPLGARGKDVLTLLNPVQGPGLTEFSAFGPPIFSQRHSSAVGVMVKGSNIVAALAGLVSQWGPQPDSIGIEKHAGKEAGWHCLSTFGQVIYWPSVVSKLTLSCLYQMPKSPVLQVGMGPFMVPVISLRSRLGSGLLLDPTNISAGTIAFMIESEVDESAKFGCWIEMQKSGERSLQWTVSVSDTPADELGWGFSIGGMIQAPSTWVSTQLEASLRFNLGKRFKLEPALAYVMDGNTRSPALMFRTSWSL